MIKEVRDKVYKILNKVFAVIAIALLITTIVLAARGQYEASESFMWGSIISALFSYVVFNKSNLN